MLVLAGGVSAFVVPTTAAETNAVAPTPITADKVASQIDLTPALGRVVRNAVAFSFEIHIQLDATDPARPSVYFRKTKADDGLLFVWDHDRQCTSVVERPPSLQADVILRTRRDLETVLGIPPRGERKKGASQ